MRKTQIILCRADTLSVQVMSLSTTKTIFVLAKIFFTKMHIKLLEVARKEPKYNLQSFLESAYAFFDFGGGVDIVRQNWGGY